MNIGHLDYLIASKLSNLSMTAKEMKGPITQMPYPLEMDTITRWERFAASSAATWRTSVHKAAEIARWKQGRSSVTTSAISVLVRFGVLGSESHHQSESLLFSLSRDY